jgi:transposase
MKRLVIKDSEGIKEKIQYYFNGNNEAKFIHRLHGILLFLGNASESCDSVGVFLGHSPRTISNWIKRINETGDIECLRDRKQPGRPSRLTEKQKHELKEIMRESPQKHGITSAVWDSKNLSHFIRMRFGVVMHPRSCQRLFHQLGFSSTIKRGRHKAN